MTETNYTKAVWWTNTHNLGLGRVGLSIQSANAEIVPCFDSALYNWEANANHIVELHNAQNLAVERERVCKEIQAHSGNATKD